MKTIPSLLFLAAAGIVVFAAAPAAATPAADLEAARALFRDRAKAPEAQRAFAALAAADPKNPEINFHLGHLAVRRGDYDAAVGCFETALAAEPAAARHHHGLGLACGLGAQRAGVLSKLGYARRALAAFQRAVELEPASVEFRQGLFDFYREAPSIGGGDLAKAAVQAEEIKRLDASRGRLAFSALYVAQKRFPDAFAQFDEVLAADPDDFFALYQIGRLAATTGQFIDRGVTSLRRCLELPPPSAVSDSGHAPVRWMLGQLLERKNDPAGARAAYEAALRDNPNFFPAAAALKKLK